jgi:GDP-4-dehydro-6-deoxy-D-mannose reductase
LTRALVIGAHGFCGRHLIRRLANVAGAEVIAIDIPRDWPDFEKVAAYVSCDIGDAESVRRVVEAARPDWIFNLAALTHGSPSSVYRANLLGPIHVLDAVRDYVPDARVLLVGSAAEYGCVAPDLLPVTEEAPCKPVGDYGISKHAMTLAALDIASRHSTRVVIARPFNIIGAGVPSSLVVGAILDRAREALKQPGEPVVKVGNLDTERDFIDVEDAVEAYAAMIQGGFWGEVFNICSGKPVRIRDLVTKALSHSPRPIRLEVDPKLVRPSDCPVIYGSFEKAKRAFGFKPRVSLADSLKKAWDHAAA